VQGWPEPFIYIVLDRIFGDFPDEITVHAPHIYGHGQPLTCVGVPATVSAESDHRLVHQLKLLTKCTPEQSLHYVKLLGNTHKQRRTWFVPTVTSAQSERRDMHLSSSWCPYFRSTEPVTWGGKAATQITESPQFCFRHSLRVSNCVCICSFYPTLKSSNTRQLRGWVEVLKTIITSPTSELDILTADNNYAWPVILTADENYACPVLLASVRSLFAAVGQSVRRVHPKASWAQYRSALKQTDDLTGLRRTTRIKHWSTQIS